MTPFRPCLLLAALVSLAVVASFRIAAAPNAFRNRLPLPFYRIPMEGEKFQSLVKKSFWPLTGEEDAGHREVILHRATAELLNNQGRSAKCHDINSTLHMNNINFPQNIIPYWVRHSPLIGHCPTKYELMEIGGPSPTFALHATCNCENSDCSNAGYRCVFVKRPIEHANSLYLGLACVCVVRISQDGGNIDDVDVQ